MPDYDTSAVPNGVKEGLDQISRTYANGKIADNIVRVNPEMLQMLGMSKEQFGSLSSADKTAATTGAITAMGLKAQQTTAAAQAADTQSQTELRLQQAAERQQQMGEDTAVGEAVRRYGSGPPAPAGATVTPDQVKSVMPPLVGGATAGGGNVISPAPTPTPAQLAPYQPTDNDRLNYALQTPGLGGKAIPKFVTALNTLRASGSRGYKGLPIAQQIQLPDGRTITGMGEQNEPNITPPGAAKGLEVGQTLTDKDGNMWVGKGIGVPPEVKLAVDVKQAKTQGDTGRGRSVFMQSAPELARQLDNLEAAIVKNNGNTKETTWDPAAVAALGQGPFQVAENYNKVVDPHSINRPEKLEQDMKHLLPMGIGTRKDVTLQAIANLRSELVNRVRNFGTVEKELPPNLPPAVQNKLIGTIPGINIPIHPDTKFDSEAQARASGAQSGDIIRMRDPATGVYRRARLK